MSIVDDERDEGRGAERVCVPLRVSFRSFAHPNGTYEGVSCDVSASGIFVEPGAHLPVGTRVKLQIDSDHPNVHRVRIDAEVVRLAGPAGIAFRFIGAAPSMIRQLMSAIEIEESDTEDLGRIIDPQGIDVFGPT